MIDLMPADIWLVGKPLKIDDPLSWFAQLTRWLSRDPGEEPTRQIWHTALVMNPHQKIEVANASKDCVKITSTKDIFKKDHSIVYRCPALTDEQRGAIVAWAMTKQGKAAFDFWGTVGLSIACAPHRFYGKREHYGWWEKNLHGWMDAKWPFRKSENFFWCNTFVAWSYSKAGILFRPELPQYKGMDVAHWEGTCMDDIMDYCELKGWEVVYNKGVLNDQRQGYLPILRAKF